MSNQLVTTQWIARCALLRLDDHQSRAEYIQETGVKPIKTKHQLVQIMIKRQWTQEDLAQLLGLTSR